MNINRLTKQILVFVLGFIAFFFLIGIAGSVDYTEQVVYTMPQEAYEAIHLELGHDCTRNQIVDKYMSNKRYYDSLAK